MIDLRDRPPGHIKAVGIDRAERADPASQRPNTRRDAVGDGDAFAAFYKRKDIDAAHLYRVDRLHGRLSREAPPAINPRRQVS